MANYVRLLNLTFPTTVVNDDGSIAVMSSLVLVPLQTRVEAVIRLRVEDGGQGEEGLEVKVVPEARMVYGEQFNTAKLEEFLRGKIGGCVQTVGGGGENKGWDVGMLELYKRLLARGSRAAAAVAAGAGAGEK